MKKTLQVATLLVFLCSTYASAEWGSPSGKACVNNGGEIKHGTTCYADYETAVRICHAVDAKLPTIDALEEVVIACGGEIDSHKRLEDDPSFETCYHRIGFSTTRLYWSSSAYDANSKNMILMHFGTAKGMTFNSPRDYKNGGVVCVK